MTGRPTTYTEDLGDKICALLSEGKSLSSICLAEDMPSRSTVLLWVVKGEKGDEAYKAFSDSYLRARQSQAHALIDDILDIADDSSGDTKIVRGQQVMDSEFVARSKLRVDARFKLAAQQHPELYGEKSKLELSLTHEQALKQLADQDDAERNGDTPPAAG